MDASRHPTTRADREWALRETATAVLILAFLTLQVGIAVRQLTQPRPAPFGWQMYAAVPERFGFVVRLPDGTRREIDPEGILGKVRGELDLQTILPPHLCSSFPLGSVVEVVAHDGRLRREHDCE